MRVWTRAVFPTPGSRLDHRGRHGRRRSPRRRPRAPRASRPCATTSPSRNEIIRRLRRAPQPCNRAPTRWVNATAAASTASGCAGTIAEAVHPLERRPHLRLVGVAHAGHGALDLVGLYSSTSMPASAATTMTAPVARATVSALTWLRLNDTRSTATAHRRMRRDRGAHGLGHEPQSLRLGHIGLGRHGVGPDEDRLAGRRARPRRGRGSPRRGPPRAHRNRTSVRAV